MTHRTESSVEVEDLLVLVDVLLEFHLEHQQVVLAVDLDESRGDAPNILVYLVNPSILQRQIRHVDSLDHRFSFHDNRLLSLQPLDLLLLLLDELLQPLDLLLLMRRLLGIELNWKVGLEDVLPTGRADLLGTHCVFEGIVGVIVHKR